MHGLKELLIKEEKRLKDIKNIVDKNLLDIPDGTLRVTTSKNAVQYIHCVEDSGEQGYKLTYIKKSDMSLARQLAQKSYDQKVKKLVDRRLKQIEKIIKEYEDNEIDKIYYELHPERKKLVITATKTWEQKLDEWKSISYVGKGFGENVPEIYTKKGERVRSKSEKIIADTFYDLGIEYKYECPLNLKGVGIIYPDFTILRKRDTKIVYWEHDGRMDDPEYAQKALRKMNSYIANDIFPGDNLIVSFESSGNVLNDRIIRKMISKYII